MSFTVEANVPIPSQTRAGKYPWRALGIGDSFLVPFDPQSHVHERRKLVNNVRTSAKGFGKRSGVRFATRVSHEGLRVWRVA